MTEEDLDEPSNSQQQQWRYKARIAQNTEPRELTYDFEFTGPEPTVNQLRRAVMERAQITEDKCNFLLMSKAIPPSDEPLSRVGLNNDMCVQVVGTRINRPRAAHRNSRFSSNNIHQPPVVRRYEPSPPPSRPGYMTNRSRDVQAHLRVLRVPPLDNRNRLEQLIREVLTDRFNFPEEAMGQVHFTYENNDIYVRLPSHRTPFIASLSMERHHHVEIISRDLRHFRETVETTRLVDHVNDILTNGDVTLSIEDVGDLAAQFERTNREARRATTDAMENYNNDERARRFEPRGEGENRYYLRHVLDSDVASVFENLIKEMNELDPIFSLYRRVLVTLRNFSGEVTEDPNLAMLVVFMEHTQRALHRISHGLHHIAEMNVDLIDQTPRRVHPTMDSNLNLNPISQGLIRITLVDPPLATMPNSSTVPSDFLHNPFENYDIELFPRNQRPIYTLNPNAMIMQQQALVFVHPVHSTPAQGTPVAAGQARPTLSPIQIPTGRRIGSIQIEATTEEGQEQINRLFQGIGMESNIRNSLPINALPQYVQVEIDTEPPRERPSFTSQIASWLNGDPITPEQFEAVTTVRDGLDAMVSPPSNFDYERAFRAFVAMTSTNLLHVMAHRINWPTDVPRNAHEYERRRELMRDLLHHIRMPVASHSRPLPNYRPPEPIAPPIEPTTADIILESEDPVTATLQALGSFGRGNEERQQPPPQTHQLRPCPRHSHSLSPTPHNHHFHHYSQQNLPGFQMHNPSSHAPPFQPHLHHNHHHSHSLPCPVHPSSQPSFAAEMQNRMRMSPHPHGSMDFTSGPTHIPINIPVGENEEIIRLSVRDPRITPANSIPPGFEMDGPPQIVTDETGQRVEIQLRRIRRPQENGQPPRPRPEDQSQNRTNRQPQMANVFLPPEQMNTAGINAAARHLFGQTFPPNLQQPQPASFLPHNSVVPAGENEERSAVRTEQPPLQQQNFNAQLQQIGNVLDNLNARMDQTSAVMREVHDRARAIAASRPSAFRHPAARPVGVAMNVLPDNIRDQLMHGYLHGQGLEPVLGEPTLLLIDPFLPCRSRHTGNFRQSATGLDAYYQTIIGNRLPPRSPNRAFPPEYSTSFVSSQSEFAFQGDTAAAEFQRLFQLTARSVLGLMWENDVETLARSSNSVFGTERDLQMYAAGLAEINSNRRNQQNGYVSVPSQAVLPSNGQLGGASVPNRQPAMLPISAPILPEQPRIALPTAESDRRDQPSTSRPVRQGNVDDSSPRQKKKRTEGRRKSNDSRHALRSIGFSQETIELILADVTTPIERTELTIGYQLGLPSNLRQTSNETSSSRAAKIDAGTQSTSSSFASKS